MAEYIEKDRVYGELEALRTTARHLNHVDGIIYTADMMERVQRMPVILVDENMAAHGHWIYDSECSVCGGSLLDDMYELPVNQFAHCPYCGAIMDEDGDNG